MTKNFIFVDSTLLESGKEPKHSVAPWTSDSKNNGTPEQVSELCESLKNKRLKWGSPQFSACQEIFQRWKLSKTLGSGKYRI